MDRMGPGEFSHRTGLSSKALRVYDDKGVLSPIAVDPTTGYRQYSSGQIQDAGRIALMRRAGISLAEIRRFQHATRPETIDGWLADLRAEFDHRRRALHALARSIGHTPDRRTPMPTATIRSVASRDELAAAFDVAGHAFEPPITRRDDVDRWSALEDGFPANRALQLVAEVNGRVVGAALGFLAADGGNATLRILGIAAEHRGQGLGAALLRSFEAGVSASGGTAVWLGADANASFYVRHGYRTILLLQWVHDPDRHRSDTDVVLSGPLAGMEHWNATFNGVPQLFVVLDEPNPALRSIVEELVQGAHVGYCMSRDVAIATPRA